ncbi:membrane protein [Streptococcus suis]|nr:membrane protein [Streptococcus suis]
MERSLFGLFTAFLCWICVLCAIQAFRKKRFGLAILFLLNAFTNLVNSIHAIYGFLFR